MAVESVYLDISSDQLPVEKFYTFGGVTYVFRVKKNDFGGFYTIQIYDTNNKNFLYSNKITYAQNVNDSVLSPINDKIIPLNVRALAGIGNITTIDDDTFGFNVKLYTDISSV